jgi:hypothetical protein
MIRRHVALVTPEEMDRAPRHAAAERIVREQAVESLRRRASGERDRRAALIACRVRQHTDDLFGRGAGERRDVVENLDLSQLRHLRPSL